MSDEWRTGPRTVNTQMDHPGNPGVSVAKFRGDLIVRGAAGAPMGKVHVSAGGCHGSVRRDGQPLFLQRRDTAFEALIDVFDELWRQQEVAYTRRPWPKPGEYPTAVAPEAEPLETVPPKKNGRRKS